MACAFSIVALPAAVADDLGERISDLLACPSGPNSLDTETVTLWRGSSSVGGRAYPVTLTLYKAPHRLRIQVMSHDVSDEERARLDDRLAEVLRATVISRHSRSGARPVLSPLEQAASSPIRPWPSWLPPPGFEPHPGSRDTIGGEAASDDEPGMHETGEPRS